MKWTYFIFHIGISWVIYLIVFLFFETVSLYSQGCPGIHSRLALNSRYPPVFCLPSAGIEGMLHYLQAQVIFFPLMLFTKERDVGRELVSVTEHFISIHKAKFSCQHQQKIHFKKENMQLEKFCYFFKVRRHQNITTII